jgi:hypothetical protein
MSELVEKHTNINVYAHLYDFFEWSELNLMNINIVKTKEMLMGRIKNEPCIIYHIKYAIM